MKPYEEMSDAELSETFALEVAGWTVASHGFWEDKSGELIWNEAKQNYELPDFATSADAVLPWLSRPFTHAKKWKVNINFSCLSDMHYVTIYDGLQVEEGTACYLGVAPSLARAACIALLRAKRGEA